MKHFIRIIFIVTCLITGVIVSDAQNDYDFQSFWQAFKSAIENNNEDTLKTMVKFPLITFYNLENKKEIKKEEFGIGEKKYFDKKFIKKIKNIDKLTRTKFVITDYSRFDLTSLSLIYELKLDKWHHATSSLYFAMDDGKVKFIGEDSFKK
jgi:hypothetical protein